MYRDFEYYRPIKLGKRCYLGKQTSYLVHQFLKLIGLIIKHQIFGLMYPLQLF